ncbi:MAG: iron-containing alcohol dehydrogenase, partial [Eubacteriales bacterium]|nr:iron-containing alcohol dehydrogenase [Eubacteriales bacterium]
LIDGKYLAFAPDHVIQNTAIDALGHLWESYMNADATDYSRMCADAGMRMFARTKEKLFARAKAPEGERTYTEEDYVNLMNASMFAGMAIAQDSTSLPHGLSYPVTYFLHMPHGAAIGYFLGGYLAEGSEEEREHMLRTSGFASLEEWKEFYETLCQKEPLADEILDHAVEVIANNESKLVKAPFPCDKEVLRRIAYWGR